MEATSPGTFTPLQPGAEQASRYTTGLGANWSWLNFRVFATRSQFMSLLTTGQFNRIVSALALTAVILPGYAPRRTASQDKPLPPTPPTPAHY